MARTLVWTAAKIILLIFLPISLASGSDLLDYNPYGLGPLSFRHVSYTAREFEGLNHHLSAWIPEEADSYPVVVFQTGFAGVIPSFLYQTVHSQIASHGFVLLAPWVAPQDMVAEYYGYNLFSFVGWARENLLKLLIENEGFPSNMTIDFSSIYYVGHSSGGHVVVNTIKHYGCDNVKGLILLSPVDGIDPYGFFPGFCITPGEQLNFEIPTIILSTGYDWKKAQQGVLEDYWTACAPDELSNYRFWNATLGPGWFMNATNYGHADTCDILLTTVNEIFHVCATSDPEPDYQLYRDFISGQIVSFAKGLEGQCEMFEYLRNSSLAPVNVTLMEERQVNSNCIKPVCKWEPSDDIWRP